MFHVIDYRSDHDWQAEPSLEYIDMERYKVFEDFVDDANSICLFQIIAVATMQKILVSTVYSGGSDANSSYLFWIIEVVVMQIYVFCSGL